MDRETRRRVLLATYAIVVSACFGEASDVRKDERPRLGELKGDVGGVVARVDGRPIYLDEVRHVLEETDGGVTKEAALDALVENDLLADEAVRRGFDTWEEVEQERKTALTRAWLRTQIGEGVSKKNFDEERLRKAYLSQKDRFVHKPLRRVDHLVVLNRKKDLSRDEVRDIAFKIYRALRDVKGEEAFLKAARSFKTEYRGKVKVESLPPFAVDSDRFVPQFTQAAFAAKRVPSTIGPIETKFGQHVIFVAEEQPAENRSFEEVRDELMSQLLPLEKQFRYQAALKDLRARTNVFIYEDIFKEQVRSP